MIARSQIPVAHSGLRPLVAGSVVAGVLGLSAAIGRRNAPDPSHPRIRAWYRRLDKPGFTPPDAVFGVAWPLLEAGMAAGGYRLMRREPSRRRTAAIALWLATTGMIAGWTELFFHRRAIAGGAVASGAMLATAAAYAGTAGRVDRGARIAALPLVGWLAFATVLATDVWRRNAPRGVGR